MALLLSNPGSLLKCSRAAVCKPVCALKTPLRTTKAVKKTSKRTVAPNKRSVAVSPSESEAAAGATQYLGLAGFSAVAGTALTLAPQAVWELLGSNDVVTVTVTSSQVGRTKKTLALVVLPHGSAPS